MSDDDTGSHDDTRSHEDAGAPPPGGSADPARMMLGLVAAAVLALGGWAAVGTLTDGSTEMDGESALPELPEPGEPRTRAMVTIGEGYGWTWVNPLPRSMPTLYDVDATRGGERMIAVGHAGTAVRYEDQALLVVATGTEETLRGVAWLDAREAIAVGDAGTLIRIGTEPTAIEGIEVTLRDVEATGGGEVIAVGDEGTILRVSDTARALESGTDADLLGAFARGAQVFVAGSEGVVLRIEGQVVETETTPVSSTLRGIGGCSTGSVYAVGDRGVILRRMRDGEWRRLATHTRETFTDVSCDHGRIAAVGAGGRVVLLSGDEMLALPSGFDRTWHAVDGGAEGRSWVVGTGGRLATIEEDHIRTRTVGPAVPIRDLAAIGGALVAVGEWGRILRQSRGGFAQAESPTDSGLAALIQIDTTRLLAVGDFGALVDIRHDSASLLGTPTRTSLRDGVGDENTLLLVGSGGAVMRGPPNGLTTSIIPDAGDIWAVAGSPAFAIAVGDQGLVLRLNESGFERVPCQVDVTLRDVARLPGGTVAVGDEGTIVRIGEGGCQVERSGGSTLHAIGVGPEGLPIAGGDHGVVIERQADGEWTRVGVNVLGASIRTIWRSDRYVYLAGTRGVIVRHILVDGT